MRSPNHEDSTITLDFDKAVTDALVYLKTLNQQYWHLHLNAPLVH